MTDEPKRRTADEMYDMVVETARALGASVARGKVPVEVSSPAALLSGLREALELADLDPAQAKILLDRIRATDPDPSPYDMVQSARELAYDIPVVYATDEDFAKEEAQARTIFGDDPEVIRWN